MPLRVSVYCQPHETYHNTYENITNVHSMSNVRLLATIEASHRPKPLHYAAAAAANAHKQAARAQTNGSIESIIFWSASKSRIFCCEWNFVCVCLCELELMRHVAHVFTFYNVRIDAHQSEKCHIAPSSEYPICCFLFV